MKQVFCGGAALLALMSASPSVQATALGDLAAQMAPGEWRQLATNNFSGMLLPNFPDDGRSPIIEFSDEAQRNPVTRKIYILGCARGGNGGSGKAYVCGSTDAEDAGFIEYDEVANSWRRMPAAPVNSGPHAYDHAAMNPVTGDYFYYESNQQTNHKVWKFANNQWTTLPVPSAAYSGFGALEFFPDMNALVFIDGGGGSYPPKAFVLPTGASSWNTVNFSHPIGQSSNFSEYSGKHQLLFFGGGTGGSRVLLKMDSQGRITRGADAPVSLGEFGADGRQTIAPGSGNLLALEDNGGGPPGSGHVWEYDPTTDQWTRHGVHPLGTPYGDTIAVLVPVPEHGVIFAVNYDGGSNNVYLYKHSSGGGVPRPGAPTALNAQ